MVSQKILDKLAQMYGEYNYKVRLQDFTDEEFTQAYHKCKPKDWYDIEDHLYKTADEEVQAHLKGFDSAEERRQMVAHIKKLQGWI